MNGKKAKRMRAAARSIQTDQPWVSYIGQKHTVNKGKRSYTSTQIRLHPHCGRKFYKEMKQGKRAFMFLSDKDIQRLIASGKMGELQNVRIHQN